jgi:hypothetical protein
MSEGENLILLGIIPDAVVDSVVVTVESVGVAVTRERTKILI